MHIHLGPAGLRTRATVSHDWLVGIMASGQQAQGGDGGREAMEGEKGQLSPREVPTG